VGKFQGLDQLHTENVRVEIHGALHVAARERKVIQSSELELWIGESRHRSLLTG
jgi:hypothetical protein